MASKFTIVSAVYGTPDIGVDVKQGLQEYLDKNPHATGFFVDPKTFGIPNPAAPQKSCGVAFTEGGGVPQYRGGHDGQTVQLDPS